MKIYKPTYGISILYFFVWLFVAMFPLFVLISIATTIVNQLPWGSFYAKEICVFGFMVVVAILLLPLVNIFASLFPTKNVELSENTISYDGKTIYLERIRHLTLRLPTISRHSHESQVLEITTDNELCMDIKRPSLALVAALKRSCYYATFVIDDWKIQLRNCLCMQVAIVFFYFVSCLLNGNKIMPFTHSNATAASLGGAAVIF